MRSLTRGRPNFECDVNRDGNKSTGLEYADDEAELRARLQANDFDVLAIRKYDFQKEWCVEADKKRDGFATAKPYTFDTAVWTAIKQYLFARSNDHCGYCESDLLANSPGEVEHYRPKSAVDGDPKHPGYYWLAYDFENYVPTCSRCNTGKGKRNQFPIAGKRMTRRGDRKKLPAALKAETPLLLNPFEHQPERHLRVFVGGGAGPVLGRVEGIDKIGRTSVEVYQLNREHLILGRRKAIEDMSVALPQVWFDRAKREQLIKQIRSGRRAYSSTCLAVLRQWLDEQEAAVQAGREQSNPSERAPAPARTRRPARTRMEKRIAGRVRRGVR